MPLQSDNLVMIGLGVQGDQRPVPEQPIFDDGIYLRWAFQRARGFPWYGYYLFRRPHKKPESLCLRRELANRRPGSTNDTTLITSAGTLSGSQLIVLSDDFGRSGSLEVDLSQQDRLTVTLPPGELAFQADLTLAFRQVSSPITCVDIKRRGPAVLRNPTEIDGVRFELRGSRNELLPQLRILQLPGLAAALPPGVDISSRLDLTLPTAATQVEVELTGVSGQVTLEALDDSGAVLARRRVTLAPSGPKTISLLAATAFTHLRLRAPQGQVLFHGLCWSLGSSAPSRLTVRALDGDTVVVESELSGVAGDTVQGTLAFDRITALEIQGGRAALIDLCWYPVSKDAQKGWEVAPDSPMPFTLPLTHPDYPAATGPVDVAAARQHAESRIIYHDGTQPDFQQLHQQLEALVRGGPSGPAMAHPGRARSRVKASASGSAEEPPHVKALHPLDLVLLGSVHPAIAQALGLYWADTTAQAGVAYDYLIVADYADIAQGTANGMIDHIEQHGFGRLDAWIAFNLSVGAAQPVKAPPTVRAYALPGATYRDRAGPDQPVRTSAGSVGLAWSVARSREGYLLPGQPVMAHVWREDQGTADNPVAGLQARQWLTKGRPVLVTSPLPTPAEEISFPADWPPPTVALRYLDFALQEGWYGYQVAWMDLFGRFSPLSAPASWQQWAPPPDPKPWYYLDPPADRVVNPTAVRILDKLPPPPPMAVEAYALDPNDPLIVKDTAYTAWRDPSPSIPGRGSVIGLRVRWWWTVAQQRQAPDVSEFRVYWHTGLNPPAGWESAAAWQARCFVCPYEERYEELTQDDKRVFQEDGREVERVVHHTGDRFYEVFLPVDGAASPFSGSSLQPTLSDPIAYVNVTVTAADSAQHSLDRWPGRGRWAGRAGNESRPAAPQRIFRVWRQAPPAPQPLVDGRPVYATPADWHGRSSVTLKWQSQPGYKLHVLRALDESVFLVDWERRMADSARGQLRDLLPADRAFPDPARETSWTVGKRQQVCDEINPLNALVPATGAGEPQQKQARKDALALYRRLSDDALRVLGSLEGNGKAFTQVTLNGLDVAGVAYTFSDSLDGRASNRFLYCGVFVDDAQNRTPRPGPCHPPVHLPDVTPPKAPVITKVFAGDPDPALPGDNKITLKWASNREPDLLEYRVFRASSAEDARDLRAMTQVAVVAADPDPAARPAEVVWTDEPVRGLVDWWYRVVAVDRPDPVDPRGGGGNVSVASTALKARAVDTTPPNSPTWIVAERRVVGGIRLAWRTDETDVICIVNRRPPGGVWMLASQRLVSSVAPFDFEFVDLDAEPNTTFEYRIVVEDPAGNCNRDTEARTV